MATELFRPLFAPVGFKYKDAAQQGLLRRSATWFIRVRHTASALCACKSRDGRPLRGTPHTFRESTKTNHKPTAKAALDAHKRSLLNGITVTKRAEQPTFGDMAAKLRRDYELNGKDLATLNWRLIPLEAAFGARRMVDILPDDIESYKNSRRQAGKTNGTINRELAALSRAFSLGCEINVLSQIPRIKKLKEAAPRSGFFSAEGYAAVLRHLPSDALRLACEIMHTYGWRKSEVMSLERRHVDMAFGTLSLDAGSTKNDDPRIVPLTPALRASLRDQLARLDAWQERTGKRTPWLFTHTEGRHQGEPIADFVRSWGTACLEAQLDLEGLTGEARERRKAELQTKPEGLVKALRHDFRRTAARNMLNTGTDEPTAMKITGHRTRVMFQRYRIVNLADMQQAVSRLSTQATPVANRQLGQLPGDVAK